MFARGGGVLLLAGGAFQADRLDRVSDRDRGAAATDRRGQKHRHHLLGVHLPDGRIVKTTEAMVPSALKRLHAGEPLAARCRTTSDPKCETARAILDRIWLGLASLDHRHCAVDHRPLAERRLQAPPNVRRSPLSRSGQLPNRDRRRGLFRRRPPVERRGAGPKARDQLAAIVARVVERIETADQERVHAEL